MTELESRRRPLAAAERRLLSGKIRRYGAHPGAVERSARLASAGIFALLWLLTLVLTDAPWPLVTGFWLVLGVLIHLWVLRDLRKESRHLPALVRSLEGALERDEAESFDVVAVAYAEFEELEDEGACYAFDLGDGRLVFLAGQQFYPSARFPSLDFSVVYPLDGGGRPADMWIEKRGAAFPPARIITASLKGELAERIPLTLEVVHGRLDELEELLARRPPE